MGIETPIRDLITRRGKRVADHVSRRQMTSRWFTPDEVVEIVEHNAADPGMKDDLERLVGQTTDDLGPIR